MPELRNITACSLPYRETKPKTYTCIMCGIQKSSTGTREPACKDCRTECIRLGWIPGPETYDCSHCGRTTRKNRKSGDKCAMCTWNHRGRKEAA